MTEMPNLGGPLGTHLPGDTVYIAPFFFTHEMNIEEVSAIFVHQPLSEDEPEEELEEPAPEEIVLSGKRRKEGRDRTKDGKVIKHSSVHLVGTIPHDAAPGLYKCRNIEARTVAGQNILFEDADNEVDFDLWVLAEPSTPPKFGLW